MQFHPVCFAHNIYFFGSKSDSNSVPYKLTQRQSFTLLTTYPWVHIFDMDKHIHLEALFNEAKVQFFPIYLFLIFLR